MHLDVDTGGEGGDAVRAEYVQRRTRGEVLIRIERRFFRAETGVCEHRRSIGGGRIDSDLEREVERERESHHVEAGSDVGRVQGTLMVNLRGDVVAMVCVRDPV